MLIPLSIFEVGLGVVVAVVCLLGGFFEVDALSLFLLSLFDPVHDLIHAFLALPLVFFHFKFKVFVLLPKLAPNDLLDFISVLHPHVFKVFSKGFELIFFVDVDCIVDQFD